jgi:hypothetical protein
MEKSFVMSRAPGFTMIIKGIWPDLSLHIIPYSILPKNFIQHKINLTHLKINLIYLKINFIHIKINPMYIEKATF